MQKSALLVPLGQKVKNFYIDSASLRWMLICFFLIGTVSCGDFSPRGFKPIGANVTPIKQLQAQPKQKLNTVYIQGKVERTIPLVKRQAYQINDGTGKIWVVTNQTGIKEGKSVVFKGKVRYKSIALGGKDYGDVYLEEE
ncbi:hypothetical protein [Calothrix rhizosoleniae]|uniref:hypothetical protein n=1 Tax=Calothrix rhizosoleniae TaxID=888997 RepID=UPI001F1D74AB|nr:hypothetical protein [Calothrix rhizosoleniae]